MSKAKEKAREYVSQKLKENGYRNFHGTECVECAYISGYTQSVTDISTENAQLREALRELVPLAERGMNDIRSLVSERESINKAKQLLTDNTKKDVKYDKQ